MPKRKARKPASCAPELQAMAEPIRKGRIIATTVLASTVVGYFVMKLSSPGAREVGRIRNETVRENTDRYLAIRTSNQAAMATILGDRAYLSADKEKTSTK